MRRKMCLVLSILFFLEALAISVYMLIQRITHVALEGALYYYVLTWYDSAVHDLRYLHSRYPWGRNCVMNIF